LPSTISSATGGEVFVPPSWSCQMTCQSEVSTGKSAGRNAL
jgi:hypothetical protein